MTTNRNRVVWCVSGLFPVYYGFCPNERAWRRELKRLGCDAVPYPQSDARVDTFVKRNDQTHCLIVTVNEKLDKRDGLSVAVLIAHEATHVWQHCCEVMAETHPSPEFEAYAMQHILGSLLFAYEETRRKLFK